MTRVDGREDSELREVAIVYERLDRVDGSARFGFGEHQLSLQSEGFRLQEYQAVLRLLFLLVGL